MQPLPIKTEGECPHLPRRMGEAVTTHNNPLAEALASLEGHSVTIEEEGDDVLLHIVKSSRRNRSASLVIRLNPSDIRDCQFIAHGHRAYNLALRLIDNLLAYIPPGRCNISLETSEERRKRRNRRR